MTNYELFKISNWELLHYDRRKKLFRGISKEEFRKMQTKRLERFQDRFFCRQTDFIERCIRRREDIAYFKTIPYEYKGDGLDNYSHYQCPGSDEISWFSICPGDPRYNYYIYDPLTVAYLKSKYEKHLQKNLRTL